jgi:hypothetical protein
VQTGVLSPPRQSRSTRQSLRSGGRPLPWTVCEKPENQ